MFKTTKSKIIFVVIFSVICIIITALLVGYKNIDITGETNEEVITEVEKKDFQGIDLAGVYNQNDLKLEEKTYQSEKVQSKYYKISGLKDQTIQNNINTEIEQIALNCYREKIKNLSEVKEVYVNVNYSANFSNTLSFYVDYVGTIADNVEDTYRGYKGINYDLTTGEKITIDKMFTSDAPIENILRESAYYSLVKNKTESTLSGDFVVNDYGNIEEEIFEFINAYKNEKLIDFYYTPSHISIYYKDELISIEMEKWAQYISIYSRYLTGETIFEADNVGLKKLYTLADLRKNDWYYCNYQKEKNYFVKIIVNNDNYGYENNENLKQIADEKIANIEQEIQKMKTLANQNTNNFYIMNYIIMIHTYQESSIMQTVTNIQEYGNSYEVTLHDFEETLEPLIKEKERGLKVDIVDEVYDFTEVLKISPQDTIEYYNLETGEKVVI